MEWSMPAQGRTPPAEPRRGGGGRIDSRDILNPAIELAGPPSGGGRINRRLGGRRGLLPSREMDMSNIVPIERIENKILLIRGQKVMLDRDLADLYGVGTRELNRAVTRNLNRFPADFMFSLNTMEFTDLMFHFGTSRWGGTRKLPRAFTEQGVAMLSSVLRSERAVQVNILIMRAFVKLRELLTSNRELARKLDDMEKKYDAQFKVVFDAIRELMKPPDKKQKAQIGFRAKGK